jgi:hypothetical protein
LKVVITKIEEKIVYTSVQYLNYQLLVKKIPEIAIVLGLFSNSLGSKVASNNLKTVLQNSDLIATASLKDELVAMVRCDFGTANRAFMSEIILDKMFVNNQIEEVLIEMIKKATAERQLIMHIL